MEASKDFRAFYENELQPLLVPLETERRKIKKLALTGILFLLGSFPLFFLNGVVQNPVIIVLAFIFVLTGMIFLVKFSNRQKKYRLLFKESIVRKVIGFTEPGLEYFPGRAIEEADYKKSGLFLTDPDRYKGDDYVQGMHGKTFFCFSELHTEQQVSNGKQTSWVTIFKGLFFIADFNKNFSGRTYVWSEKNPQLNFLSRFFSSFARKLEVVKLESPEFEKRFIVYSNDQVEARYILTPSFMERAVKLQEMMGKGVCFSFIDTNIYVAVPIKDDLFEPSLFAANDFSRLEDFRTTLGIVYDIMDELRLNDRLWGKE